MSHINDNGYGISFDAVLLLQITNFHITNYQNNTKEFTIALK
jgi:hypothetical protein